MIRSLRFQWRTAYPGLVAVMVTLLVIFTLAGQLGDSDYFQGMQMGIQYGIMGAVPGLGMVMTTTALGIALSMGDQRSSYFKALQIIALIHGLALVAVTAVTRDAYMPLPLWMYLIVGTVTFLFGAAMGGIIEKRRKLGMVIYMVGILLFVSGLGAYNALADFTSFVPRAIILGVLLVVFVVSEVLVYRRIHRGTVR